MKHTAVEGRDARREPRYALVSKVASWPRLENSWAANVSASGMGLVATSPPSESKIDLSFHLPVSGEVVRVGGSVVWQRSVRGGTAMGVAFDAPPPMLREELSRFDFEEVGARLLAARGLQQLVAQQLVPPVSATMRDVVELAGKLAPHQTPVLIQGQPGSGKRTLCVTLHQRSGRAGPLWLVDCSEPVGWGEMLMVGGTVVLSEVGALSRSDQAQLLRFMDSSSVRFVATTSEDLGAMHDRQLCGDLYYRLEPMRVCVPSLAERREDIIPLATHFAEEAGGHFDLDAQARAALLAHCWPGGILELRQSMVRAVMLAAGKTIERGHLPEQIVGTTKPRSQGDLNQRLRHLEREIIGEAMRRNRGVVRRAAVELGMNPITLGRRVKLYGIGQVPSKKRKGR